MTVPADARQRAIDRIAMHDPVEIMAQPRRQNGSKARRKDFDPHQPRDPNGEWGDGVPGSSPNFDMSGLSDVVDVEGNFGDLAMAVHDTGDVRLAFQEDGHVRELDLGIDEVGELGTAVERLAGERDNLPDDAEQLGIYDQEWFGYGQHHKAELLGSGLIEVVFGADEDDPWTLQLDPDEEVDDVQLLLDAIDHVADASAAIDDQNRAVA